MANPIVIPGVRYYYHPIFQVRKLRHTEISDLLTVTQWWSRAALGPFGWGWGREGGHIPRETREGFPAAEALGALPPPEPLLPSPGAGQ